MTGDLEIAAKLRYSSMISMSGRNAAAANQREPARLGRFKPVLVSL
jgi:hypothetical protein